MHLSIASRTALATSLIRAHHTRSAPQPLIDDHWGDSLVPPVVRSSPLAQDDLLRANAAYADVILRARYCDDALQAARARGATQYLILGAGFDSQVCRPCAPGQQVFELDHPATQDLKRQRLHDCGIAVPPTHHFIAADLGQEPLTEALTRSPFQRSALTFCSWLGVTMYLPREANLACLASISDNCPPGSELVFSYVDEAVFASDYANREFDALRQQVAAHGEPFVSGFDPAAVGELLNRCGFELLEDLNGNEMVARYDAKEINGLRSNPAARIAHARVRHVPHVRNVGRP